MEAPTPSLTEEDLTEVKKDVSSSAGLGAAGRAGAEESGNPEPSDEELEVGRRRGRGPADLPASRELAGGDPPAPCESTEKLSAPAWGRPCRPLPADGSPPG